MTATDTTAWPTSALHAAGTAFAALTCDPHPLSLDCDTLGAGLGLPAGTVSLQVLRDWMLAHPTAYAARDAVWREVITRARMGGPPWVIAAVGLALPALTGFAGHLAAGYRGDTTDLDTAILTGFLEALRGRLDLAASGLYAKLIFAARRAGYRARADEHPYIPVPDIDTIPCSRMPDLPYRHPDLLVARAAELGVIDPADAGVWVEVRLGHRAIEPLAAHLGVSVDALRMRLARADIRLAEALADGLLTGLVSAEARDALAEEAARRAAVRAGKAAASAAGARPVLAAA